MRGVRIVCNGNWTVAIFLSLALVLVTAGRSLAVAGAGCMYVFTSESFEELEDQQVVRARNALNHRRARLNFGSATLGTVEVGDVMHIDGRRHVVIEIRTILGAVQFLFMDQDNLNVVQDHLDG